MKVGPRSTCGVFNLSFVHAGPRVAREVLLLEVEPVAGGIQQPWVVVGALHTRVESQGLAGKLSDGRCIDQAKGSFFCHLHLFCRWPFFL